MKPRTTLLYKDRKSFVGGTTTYSRPLWYDDRLLVPSPGVANGDFSSPNSFSYNRTAKQSLDGSTAIWSKSTGALISSIEGCIGNTPTGSISAAPYLNILTEQAYGELVEKVRGSIDLSVALLQGGQTASMLRSANRTLQYVRSFKKLRLKEAWRDFTRDGPISKKVGSKWLEFQYGWKPLAQDAYNTAVELGRQFPELMIIDVKKHSREVQQGTWLWEQYATRWPQDRTLECRYRIKARFKPTSAIENLLGNFTSLNPASIAWEMTPYSFVVDWFVDFGGYMRNLESFFLQRQLWKDGFEYLGYKQETNTYAHGVRDIGSSNRQISACSSKNVITSYSRTRLTYMPMPNPPSFKMNLGSGRLLNAAALISQHMR